MKLAQIVCLGAAPKFNLLVNVRAIAPNFIVLDRSVSEDRTFSRDDLSHTKNATPISAQQARRWRPPEPMPRMEQRCNFWRAHMMPIMPTEVEVLTASVSDQDFERELQLVRSGSNSD